MRVIRYRRISLAVAPLVLSACQPHIVWQPLPRDVIVVDSAAAFKVEGEGSSRRLALPKERSLFERPDAKELLLFRISKGALEPRPCSISDGFIAGEFHGGEEYLLHVPLTLWTQNKYNLFCGITGIRDLVLTADPRFLDPLCTRVLCPAEPFFADRLLDEFPYLQRFPNEFPRERLKQMEIVPIPKETGDDFAAPRGGFGGICDQCFGRDWERVIVIGCHWPPPPPRPCWAQAGPSPNTLGQVENIANREVVGGINAAAPHPTNAQIVFAGGVNGGIWRSDNATAANPNWIRQTDTAESLSIGALEFDPTDPSNQTLVAGIGRFSSFSRRGGALPGLLRTTNGGTVWAGIDGGGTLRGLNISGVAPRGGTIVISVNTATSAANAGVWRSTNTGAAWTRISGGAGTGLPAGAAFDLAGDPANPARLFTNAGGNGVFRSTDTGATWTSVGSAAMNGLLAAAGNVEFSIGSSNNVFVAIVGGGRLSGIFRSGDGGTTWTSMDLPAAANGGLHPGGQGGIHLSIAADRTNANIVYVGGDRQNNPFPNVFGARDFSGLLFRGNASLPAGSQFTPLTHVGTTSNSSPHADSRDMDVDANGVVIEGDDGGIYRRTSPLNAAGDWFSMNGNLQTTEFHAIAWDANANIIVGGAQDTGSPQQQATGNVTWQSISTADGGDVAVDDTSTPGRSTRYSSNQFLGSFRRRVFNASNVLQSQVFPARTVLSGGAALQAQFYTPIKLNNVDATRLIIGGANSVYESLDQGDTLTEIGPGIVVNGTGNDPIAYGATGNANMLYVGSASRVLVRTAAAPAALAPSTYAGGAVVDLAIDPGAPNTAFAADATRVYMTANAGATWTDVTGNLAALTPGTIRSLVFRSGLNRAVVIGTDTGVFIAPGAAFNSWSRLGDCLPRVPVYDLDYDPTDRKFVAGTLGRGAWLLENQ